MSLIRLGFTYTLQIIPIKKANFMRPFYIDYPQEKIEEYMHAYRCAYCKIPTTLIFGKLENHDVNCEYRRSQSKEDQLEATLEPTAQKLAEANIDETD
jgi:hypothetical protein